MISVIIPCYNVEKYIERCLDSLVSQTIFNQLQLICIDDGSSDGTADLIRGYQLKHQNIILEIQTNQGQSAARNRGLKIATGMYIGFIDSDDWINECYYEVLLNKIVETHADLVFCNMVTAHENGRIDVTNARDYKIDQFSYLDVSSKAQKNQAIKQFLMDRVSVSPCNKLMRADLLLSSELEFSIGLYNEDMEFTFDLLMLAQKIAKTDDAIYYYWQRRESTTTVSDTRTLDMLQIVNNIKYKTNLAFGNENKYELVHFELLFSVYLTLLRLKKGTTLDKKELVFKVCSLLRGYHVKEILFANEHPLKRRGIFLVAKFFPKLFSYLL